MIRGNFAPPTTQDLCRKMNTDNSQDMQAQAPVPTPTTADQWSEAKIQPKQVDNMAYADVYGDDYGDDYAPDDDGDRESHYR